MSKYEIYEKLGKGAFSTVFAGRNGNDGNSIVAVKIVKSKNIDPGRISKEIKALSLRPVHDNLLNLLEYFPFRSSIFIVTDYCVCSLLKIIKNPSERSSLTISQVNQVIFQVFSGVDHLHKNGFIHCDIKSSNILVTAEGNLKIADFGEVREVPLYGSLKLSHPVGTPGYQAPEVKNPPFVITFCVDYYSIGATICHLVTGDLPFKRDFNENLIKLVKTKSIFPEEKPEKSLLNFPKKFVEIEKYVKLFLDKDIQKRIQGYRLWKTEKEDFSKGTPFPKKSAKLGRTLSKKEFDKYCPLGSLSTKLISEIRENI
ncbi:hypothetical protein FO519_003765 [Halicephalobus sp. NKZ332]|nr:hypothetical protein FO519_003765 [Halicephalobus sp. NKZ332]